MSVVYIAGPYTGNIDRNIQQAREIAIKLWQMGHTALCPHLNTAHFEVDCTSGYDDYIRGDLDQLSRCDAIVMTKDWLASKGAVGERVYAEKLGIPAAVVHRWPTPTTSTAQVMEVHSVIANAARLERFWAALERAADLVDNTEKNETRLADTLTGTTAGRAGGNTTTLERGNAADGEDTP